MPITKLTPTAFEDNVKFRNLIINGDMNIFQRATSATAAPSNGYSTVDRFRFFENTSGAFTSEQSTDVPSGEGFSYSLKLDVTTADTSIAASEYSGFSQSIEGQNLQYLKYGTANAETLTLSFWVKSSKTGTYSIMLDKNDTPRYRFVKEYTIDTADTWEKKIITIEPDSLIKASGGAIGNDNGVGFTLWFNLAWGSNFTGATDNTWLVQADNDYYATGNEVNWMDNTSNDFYLTGVQLEAASAPSDFEFLPYEVNLQRCKRYAFKASGRMGISGHVWNSSTIYMSFQYPVEMRASPSITVNSQPSMAVGGGNKTASSTSINSPNQRACWLIPIVSGASTGQGAQISGGNILFHAEL